MQRLSLYALCFTFVCVSSAFAEEKKAEEKPQEKITFVDHVLPIFRARCGSCHNANDRKGGLAVDQYGLLMEGGSSGSVIEAGDASFSYLYMLVNHEDTPKMPPNADKLPENELAMIKKWIDLGALENSGSTANIKKKQSLAKIEVSGTRPAEVAMPARYLGEPVHLPSSRNAVTALATSPWAPLTAVSGFKQVSIYNTNTMELLGVLPYPEGQAEIMRFSRSGDLLMVGGGRGGSLGKVIVFDVRTGERKAEIGNEYDVVLGADISPDQSKVALGGPKKMIRAYTTAGELLFENKKHTDWVMSAQFSPDGVLMASGDRAGGLIVWEADTGRLFYDLIGHKGSINSISWRPDSNVLASASEDGTIKLWDMNNGNQIKSWNAHGGGVAGLEYTRDGNIVSTGRDKVTRLWNGDGAKIRDFPAFADIGMEVTYDDESKRVIAGDWTGMLSVWNADNGEVIGQIDTNPPTIAMQIQSLDQKIAAAATDLTNKTNATNSLKQKITDREKAAALAQSEHAKSMEAYNAAKLAKSAADKLVNDNNGKLASLNNAFNAATNAKKAADDKLNQGNSVVASAKQNVDAVQAKVNQANEVVKQAQQGAETAKKSAEDALAKAAPTEEEQKALETDEAVKKAVAERQAAAEASKVASEKSQQALLAATTAQQEQAKALTAAQQVHQDATKQLEVLAKAVTDTQAALTNATNARNTQQEVVKKSQAAQVNAVQAEKAALDNSNKLKAMADKAVAAAKATAEEQKAITDAEAATALAQQALTNLQDHLKRLQATQSELATVSKTE